MFRQLHISSRSELEGVAELRYTFDNEISHNALPNTCLMERQSRELQRQTLQVPDCGPKTWIDVTKRGRISAFLDAYLEPLLHKPGTSLMSFGITRPKYRRKGILTSLMKLASKESQTSYLRATLPLMPPPPTKRSVEFLGKHGFRRLRWQQLSRIYDPDDLSILEQVFDENTHLPIQFGPNKEYTIMLAEEQHLDALTLHRLDLAKNLNYSTHYELVESSVWHLIDHQDDSKPLSSLFVIMKDNEVVATTRVTPRFSVWLGLMSLEIRDIIISEPYRKSGLLRWIFHSSFIAGKALLHPDDEINPESRVRRALQAVTWVPFESLVAHFQQEIPYLVATGNTYYENFC